MSNASIRAESGEGFASTASTSEKTRVRNGEYQVEDVERAVLLAEGALQKVKRELASASTDEERARLEKKRAMIKRAIDAMNNL